MVLKFGEHFGFRPPTKMCLLSEEVDDGEVVQGDHGVSLMNRLGKEMVIEVTMQLSSRLLNLRAI